MSDLKGLEAQVNEVRHPNTNKKGMKQGMQTPIIAVMEHTGWLEKGTSLMGKKLYPFVRANSHPETGFFKEKQLLGSDGLPLTRVGPRIEHVSDSLSKYKFDNPKYDICTAIEWEHKDAEKINTK